LKNMDTDPRTFIRIALVQFGPSPRVKPRNPSSLMRLIKPLKTFEYLYLLSGGRIGSLVILTSRMSGGQH
jgi:hypothetical protein